MEIIEDKNTVIKRDIARFYLTGQVKLKDIMNHYGLKPHSINDLVTELTNELKNKENNLY